MTAVGAADRAWLRWPRTKRRRWPSRGAPHPPHRAATPAHAAAGEALRELAGLWGQPPGPGEPCQAALKLNLHCHQGRGGLYELHLLDRPAMLTLHDGATVGYVVLTGMDENTPP